MRVLITGGTGLIGRPLSQSLVADGHEVIVLSRSASAPRNGVAGVQYVQWDGRTAAGWGQHADGAQAIINLAGEGIADGRWTNARRQRILQSRLDAGKAVLEAIAAAAQKPAVLVQASGVDYYGPHGDEVLTEGASPGTTWLAHVAWEWENCTAAAQRMGVRRAVARTGIVLSRDGGAFPKMKLPFDLVIGGGALGDGKQWLPWIHIEDEVRALRFLIDNPQAQGAFNLATPNPVTYKEFAKTLGDVMGRPSFMPAPGFAIKAALGEMAELLLTGKRAMPSRLQELGFTFRHPELAPALRVLLNKAPASTPAAAAA